MTVLVVSCANTLCPVDIVVASQGIHSDSQPFFALLATVTDGTTTIRETVRGNRFYDAQGLITLARPSRFMAPASS
jgi:UDP-N-acetylglucosamine enolpyruvyl transferase